MKIFFKKSAFTLLEVMMAMTMLIITLVAIYNISSQVKASMLSTEDRVTALYLSQEGLEFMRNSRDSYLSSSWNKEYGWNAFLKEIYGTGADLLKSQVTTMKLGTGDFKTFVLEPSKNVDVNSIDDICRNEEDLDDCIYEKITILKNEYNSNDKTPRDYYRKLVISKKTGETNIIKVDSMIYWENKGTIERFSLDFKLANIAIY